MKITRKLMQIILAGSLCLSTILTAKRALKVTPQSLGYELSEEELASELQAATRTRLPAQPAANIDPDEFEKVYTSFIS